MYAITVHQPYASLIAAGVKQYELRNWTAPNRYCKQRIAIHAGKRPMDTGDMIDLRYILEEHGGWGTGITNVEVAINVLNRMESRPGSIYYGCVLCTAFMGTSKHCSDVFKDVRPEEFDDFKPNDFAWPLTNIEPVSPPFPIKGEQRFWKFDERLVG